MKTITKWFAATAVAAMLLPGVGLAMDHSSMNHGSMNHGSMGGMNMGGEAKAAAPKVGDIFHESTVQGYKLEYRLIGMEAMMKQMPSMKDMDMSKMKSHHLMLYIAKGDGMAVTDAKVGYLITGPDKSEQKVMAMGMTGGFGGDVELRAKGEHKISAKIVAGDKTLTDTFSYTVK